MPKPAAKAPVKKSPKTVHAKVVKKIARKRGVPKGSAHQEAARAAIKDKFATVKPKNAKSVKAIKKAPVKKAAPAPPKKVEAKKTLQSL